MLADIEAQRRSQEQAVRALERVQGSASSVAKKNYDRRLATLNTQVRCGYVPP